MALLVVVFAGTALAKNINGNDGNNILIGTDRGDVIRGFDGDAVIRGRGGNDVLIGGLGDDKLLGGRGKDTIDAVDGSGGDFVVCGSGFDKVRADVGDIVSVDCEDVQRVEGTPPPDDGDADCSDNLDNDGDGKTDFPNDPGCSSASDPSEVDGGNGGGDDKVVICHKPGTSAEKTKKVPESAVNAHLGHGDTLGPCDGGDDDDGDDHDDDD